MQAYWLILCTVVSLTLHTNGQTTQMHGHAHGHDMTARMGTTNSHMQGHGSHTDHAAMATHQGHGHMGHGHTNSPHAGHNNTNCNMTALCDMCSTMCVGNHGSGHQGGNHGNGHQTGNHGNGHKTGQHQSHGSGHMMLMYFHINETIEAILFKPWQVHDWKAMLGSCIGIAIVAILYEGLKVFREYLQSRNKQSEYKEKKSCISRTALHLIQTVLHMIQVFVSYCLMLVFMTYNAWLCISVIVGAGLGYLMFGWMRTSTSIADSAEHCN